MTRHTETISDEEMDRLEALQDAAERGELKSTPVSPEDEAKILEMGRQMARGEVVTLVRPGRPRIDKTPTSVTQTVRITPNTAVRLDEVSKRTATGKAQIIRTALDEYLAKQ